MSLKVKRIMRKLKSFIPMMKGLGTVSFSQFGEDIIMLKMLDRYNVTDISYFDIGANDPIAGSNTYNFYTRGYTGILIEPNLALCNKIKSVRPNDKCLNFGISSGNQKEADYFMFSDEQSGMNTFSEEEANRYEKEGFPIKQKIKMPLKDINEVLAENFTKPPTIISLDVEGLDEMILEKMDLEKFPALLICVETVIFNKDKEFVKRKSIIDLLASKGYFIYADTHVNTIFCSRKLFDKLIA
ncbi:hypothetical protein CJD36_010585 [Flavipsychrobacter stenotrophus]|uniref:Methyltransferase FkbM domain-containing protein n=1 Tax=Flavipsychrobacter stenotrophus TaxID=2077091 RepID=A0A2S7SV59_9BACT|nr:FkbM family methyltransferase [Flavipsychrobacter stenotrophus]PQJ10416.1 hypothetical protein CJD36_010585 [Flavipsychrobacter stenotrophus]